MKPRKEPKQDPKAVESRKRAPRPKLQIVKLEERIAPKLATNHNETLVREPAKGKPKSAPRKAQQKPRLQIVKLESRIAPSGIPCQDELSCGRKNHNETLVRESTKAKPKAEPRKAQQKPKLQIAKLEERIAPRPIPSNHNETLVRDRG